MESAENIEGRESHVPNTAKKWGGDKPPKPFLYSILRVLGSPGALLRKPLWEWWRQISLSIYLLFVHFDFSFLMEMVDCGEGKTTSLQLWSPLATASKCEEQTKLHM